MLELSKIELETPWLVDRHLPKASASLKSARFSEKWSDTFLSILCHSSDSRIGIVDRQLAGGKEQFSHYNKNIPGQKVDLKT